VIDRPIPVETLRIPDLRAYPVWQFSSEVHGDETMVQPLGELPVSSLAGRLVAAEVMLANGSTVWALIGNIDTHDARSTEHFLTASIEHEGRWFSLARYHDVDWKENGPDALASFLKLPPEEVFPIMYDVRNYASGHKDALRGQIRSEPRARLSRAEIIAMAIG
jgi:hypothetical protein